MTLSTQSWKISYDLFHPNDQRFEFQPRACLMSQRASCFPLTVKIYCSHPSGRFLRMKAHHSEIMKYAAYITMTAHTCNKRVVSLVMLHRNEVKLGCWWNWLDNFCRMLHSHKDQTKSMNALSVLVWTQGVDGKRPQQCGLGDWIHAIWSSGH